MKHKAKCSICKEYPIVGFRFVGTFCWFVRFIEFFFLVFGFLLLLLRSASYKLMQVYIQVANQWQFFVDSGV